MIEDESVIESINDEQVIRIVRATNFKGFKLGDGQSALGYAMPDGSYLVVRPTEGIGMSAAHPGWEAARLDVNGQGLRCSNLLGLHEAVVQTFKTPSPIYEVGSDIRVAEGYFDGEVVSPEDALAAAKRADAEQILANAVAPR